MTHAETYADELKMMRREIVCDRSCFFRQLTKVPGCVQFGLRPDCGGSARKETSSATSKEAAGAVADEPRHRPGSSGTHPGFGRPNRAKEHFVVAVQQGACEVTRLSCRDKLCFGLTYSTARPWHRLRTTKPIPSSALMLPASINLQEILVFLCVDTYRLLPIFDQRSDK